MLSKSLWNNSHPQFNLNHNQKSQPTFVEWNQNIRTTVPIAIIKQFNLKPWDKLRWSFKAEEGKLIIIVDPIKWELRCNQDVKSQHNRASCHMYSGDTRRSLALTFDCRHYSFLKCAFEPILTSLETQLIQKKQCNECSNSCCDGNVKGMHGY